MEKPIVSDNFTIEDIHKIREYNYEMTKNMTTEERRAYYRRGFDEIAEKYPNIKKALERGKVAV
jgi:hypothetical protein